MKRARLAALVALAALLVAPLRAEIIEQVLVRVNGDIITKSDFEQRQISALRNRDDLTTLSAESPELRQAIEEMTPSLILDAVDELLLVQRGRELGYVLSDEQFQGVLANIKQQNNLEDDERFQAALQQEGMTLADLRRQLERQMIVNQVQQNEVVNKIAISEDEAREFYATRQQSFTTPASVTLREILIEVPASTLGVNVAEDDAARAEADVVRTRLLAGEPFPRLAAEVSDSSSKANGGLIGPLTVDELAPALQTLLRGMNVGDLTGVLRVPRGYQIIKLETRAESKTRTFEEARDDISQAVAEQKRVAELGRYLERLRTQATISWRNDELQKAYDIALAERLRTLTAPSAAPAAGN
ncbi:MAG: hypothetical protein HOP14_15215 [Acidobacteria bacterium]|nr:hypothetical protein [Acidobacteriota bacterium]